MQIFFFLLMCREDREFREVELDELRHLLEDNHSAITEWKADAAENAKVICFPTKKKYTRFLVQYNVKLIYMFLLFL